MLSRLLMVLLAALTILACGGPPAKTSHKSPPPARITNGKPEATTALVSLTKRAVERIGIKTVVVEKKSMPRWRTFPARTEIRPGSRIEIAAPIAGQIQAAPDGGFVTPMSRVNAGQALAQLKPLLAPERFVPNQFEVIGIETRKGDIAVLRREAEAMVEAARVQKDGAEIILKRAQGLVGKTVSQRELDDAVIAHNTARVALQEAQKRLAVVNDLKLKSEDEVDAPKAVVLTAGGKGLVEEVRASEGQMVAAGTVIASLLEDSELLVTVPVYAGELSRLAPQEGAVAIPLGGGEATSLKQVAGPPTGDALAATVRLYFGLNNPEGRWQIGERLSVRLRTTETEEVLVLPWSAIHYDFNGGTWVYVAESEVDFRRARVDFARREGDLAVLHSGPAPGSRIVSVGAVELFGTEFGTGK